MISLMSDERFSWIIIVILILGIGALGVIEDAIHSRHNSKEDSK